MSSTVGKIHGQVLENNLLRNGVDLAFDTDLIYLDVNSGRIGINTDTPFRPLLVNGTLSSTDVLVDTGTISNFSFALNTITNNASEIIISATGPGATITAGGATTDGISIDANGIRSLRSNEDIDLTPAGAGEIKLLTNTEVNGSVHVTGNVTFDGNIVFGNNNLDSVSLSANINSDINSNQTATYDLGRFNRRWDNLYTELINGSTITAGGAFIGGIDLGLRHGNTWYVATNGSSGNVGDHPNGPFDTVEKALSVATSGDTILIYPGTYYELLPLTVPVGVTVKGIGIRSVTIKPDTSSGGENVFLLNGETTVEDLTVSDFFYDSINDTGYAFSFAPGFIVTSRSPYVRNITVITTGSITSGTDPRGFAAGDAGKGAKVDGSLALPGTNEASMLFHSCTFITPGVDAITMTNGVRIEWLNCFTYFAERGLYATQGTGRVTQDGSTLRYGAEIRSIGSANVYGTYGAVADGADTLMYLISHNFAYIGLDGDSENDPSSAIQVNEVVELNSGVVHYQTVDQSGNYRIGDLVTIEQSTGKIILNSVAISSTNITVTDGVTSSYIDAFEVTTGNITVSGNTLQSNTGGMILTAANTDLDVTSNLTVNQSLTVEQLVTLDKNVTIGNSSSDTIYFNSRVNSDIIPNANNLDLGINANRWKTLYTTQATFDDILINTNFISTTLSNSNLEFGATGTGVIRIDALDINSNTISSNVTNTDININPNGTGKIQLLKDTDITGNLSVTGNITVGGNIQLGDAVIDSIDPVGKIGSDLIPNITGIFNVGSATKIWHSIFASELITDDVLINTNFISTTLSNSNLELRANGTGTVRIDTLDFKSNTISSNTTNTDINVVPNGTGKIQLLKDTDITGNLEVTGNITVEGNIQLGDVAIDSIDPVGKIGSNLIPNITGIYNIGSAIKTWRTMFASELITDDVLINTNFISTTLSNSNLELRANGTGTVRVDTLDFKSNIISSNATNIDININPNGTGKIQLLKDTDVTGNLSVTGNINVGGNIQLGDVAIDSIDPVGKIGSDLIPNTTGIYDIGSAIRTWRNLFTSNVVTDDIEINDNYIRTTASNSNLELRANGSGIVNVTDSVSVVQNLTVNGLTNLKNTSIDGLLTASAGLVITNNLSASTFITDDIIFDENYFTTTLSNSNLELRANGTGNVVFDNVLQINESTISNSLASGTEANRSIIFNPVNGKNVTIQSTKALQLPIGNNTNRTLTTNGEIRYNNTSSTFEGKVTGGNISLYNLFDTDGNTGISPELTPGANDNTIRMYTNNVLSATITAQAATFNRIIVDEIDINNNIIDTINSNADLELERSGTGVVNIKNSINITDNSITNTTIDAVTQIVSTGNGYVKFVGTGAIRIPHGLTGQQPVTAPIGATRYNTTTFTQEVYNGTAWISAAGTGVDVVSAEDMELISDLYGLVFG